MINGGRTPQLGLKSTIPEFEQGRFRSLSTMENKPKDIRKIIATNQKLPKTIIKNALKKGGSDGTESVRNGFLDGQHKPFQTIFSKDEITHLVKEFNDIKILPKINHKKVN